MQTRSRRYGVKKCLFGGTLLSAGLATQGAQALSFDLIDNSASVNAYYSSSFRVSGPWSIEESYQTYSGWGSAAAWGMSTSLGLYAYGQDKLWFPTSYANVLSQFTVTSDVSVTLEYGLFPFFDIFGQPSPSDSSLTLTDLTNDVTLFFRDEDGQGSQDFQLFAGTLYEFNSFTNNGFVSLTIIPAPASAALLLGMGGLSGLVGRRRRRI